MSNNSVLFPSTILPTHFLFHPSRNNREKVIKIRDLKIPNYLESRFDAQFEKVTNDTYLKVFQNNLFDTPVMPDSQTTMNSNLKLYLEKENQTNENKGHLDLRLPSINSSHFN